MDQKIINVNNIESEKEDRIQEFKEKLKRHMSDEYLYIVEKKDDLENQIRQMKLEFDRKNKTLFPNIEQKNVRQYFSPLNIQETPKNDNGEKNKQLTIHLRKIQDEVNQLSRRMEEIKEYLRDIDDILLLPNNVKEDKDYSEEITENINIQDNKYDYIEDSSIERTYKEEKENDKITPDHKEYIYEGKEIYPQMIRNLYDFADYIKREFKQIEVLIEFNDNNIETSIEVNKNLMNQLNYNIYKTLNEFNISGIFIQGEVKTKSINVIMSYVSDNEDINAITVSYYLEYKS